MPDPTTYDFACGDLMDGCSSSFRGTRDQVLEQVAEHAREVHGIEQVTPTIEDTVRDRLQPVA